MSELREKIKKVLLDSCGSDCSNGSDYDYIAVDSIISVVNKDKNNKEIDWKDLEMNIMVRLHNYMDDKRVIYESDKFIEMFKKFYESNLLKALGEGEHDS